MRWLPVTGHLTFEATTKKIKTKTNKTRINTQTKQNDIKQHVNWRAQENTDVVDDDDDYDLIVLEHTRIHRTTHSYVS